METTFVPDSTSGRMLPWLSCLGAGTDVVNGRPATKTGKRLPIRISSSLFRRFTCTEGCLVCCARLSVSLDYVPTETSWINILEASHGMGFVAKIVNVNGVDYEVMTKPKIGYRDNQRREANVDTLSRYCSFLKPVRHGQPGCSLWETGSPLGCASSYNMRVTEYADHVQITKQGMSRSWLYDPAPECVFEDVPIEEADVVTNVHLLHRFFEWAQYFNMQTSVERLTQLIYALENVLSTGDVPSIIEVI